MAKDYGTFPLCHKGQGRIPIPGAGFLHGCDQTLRRGLMVRGDSGNISTGFSESARCPCRISRLYEALPSPSSTNRCGLAPSFCAKPQRLGKRYSGEYVFDSSASLVRGAPSSNIAAGNATTQALQNPAPRKRIEVSIAQTLVATGSPCVCS